MKTVELSALVLGIIAFTSCVRLSPVEKAGINNVKAEIPVEWRYANESNGSSNIIGYWADSFSDPRLNESIRTAWSSNPDLMVHAEKTLAKGEEAVILGANLYPKANLGVSGTKSKRNLIGFNFPNGSTSFTSESFESGLNISWELDLWGKFRKVRGAAETRFEIAKTDYEAARLSVAGKVAKSWFEIIERKKQLELSKQTVETYQKNKDFVLKRFQNGLANSLDKDLAESALASSQATLSSWLRLSNDSRRSLRLLLGEYSLQGEDFNASTTLPNLDSTYLPIAPAQALENRPDLISARLALEAAGFDYQVAKLNLLPSLTISGGPGSRTDQFENLLDQEFRTWQIGGNLTTPIFQGGKIKAQIRRSNALKKAALANYRSTALRAFHEVETLLFKENQLIAEENYLANASRAAKSVADSSWDRYQKGIQGIFDTLESQRRLFDSESRLLATQKERIVNRINLYLALGIPALSFEP